MRRPFLSGVLAIALLCGVSVAFISWVTRASPPSSADAPAAAAARHAVAPEAPPAVVQPAAPAPGLASASAAPTLEAPSAPPAAPEFKPATARRAPRGSSNGLVAGLSGLQPLVAQCTGIGSRSRPGLQGGGAVEGTRPEARQPTILMLELEPLEGRVRVVDTTVAAGTASDALVACAREALRGQVVSVGEARPGGHIRVPFPLKR